MTNLIADDFIDNVIRGRGDKLTDIDAIKTGRMFPAERGCKIRHVFPAFRFLLDESIILSLIKCS